jgi:hypothetical protein
MNRTVVLNAMLASWLDRGRVPVRATPREHCEALLDAALDTGAFEITAETSDGYHTFAELYQHRALLAAGLFNAWHHSDHDPVYPPDLDQAINPYKTWHHHPDDSTPMFPGMFKVGATLETGEITYHYESEHWDLFCIPERQHSPLWDGHTSADVSRRLENFLRD